MKHRKITGLLAVAFVSVCFLNAACGKKSDTVESNEKPKEETLSADPDEKDSSSAEGETSEVEVSSSESDETSNRVVDLTLSDYQKQLAAPPSETDSDGNSNQPKKMTATIDMEDACLGAIATANKAHSYYVVHYDKHYASIEEENNSTYEAILIYSTTPQPDVEPKIDSLILVGDYLYFRESDTLVKRINLSDYSVEDILEGNIERLTYYHDYLYFEEDGSIHRVDLDGNAEDILFTAAKAPSGTHVPFCFVGDMICYVDPEEPADDGLFYGKIFIMDADGNNCEELEIGAESSSFVPMVSDGENICFWGRSTLEDGSEFTGLISCKLDGSDMFFYENEADDLYYYNGKLYKLWMNSIWEVDGYNISEIWGGNAFEVPSQVTGFAVVGDWTYLSGANAFYRTGEVTIRISASGDYIVYIDPT
ncbi:MAG: DUF5050 domain-containing protein [Clostridiales bacterium]|nr:DUF5050 domain-containing protein [Clostridiales bacterium]